MTFKHTKFEDSVTMRSLEKLATEKGLIKNDPLKKIAEKKAKTDLKPTGNLTENIMKLCAGLREAGFAKYAEELESTYIMYKKAATECDNDILQQAHPKGSHKLEGVEGDATIETIIDQHLANMKMVNKKPTGKLTNANSIINAVKISLGYHQLVDIMRGIRDRILQSQRLANSAGELTDTIAGKADATVVEIFSIIGPIEAAPETATSNKINSIANKVNRLVKLYEYNSAQLYSSPLETIFPESLSQGIKDPSTWSIVSGYLSGALQLCAKAKQELVRSTQETAGLSSEPKPVQIEEVQIAGTPKFSGLRTKIFDLKSKLNAYKAVINLYESYEDKQAGNAYISSTMAKLSAIDESLNQIDPSQADIVLPRLTAQVNAIDEDVAGFYQDWIK